jgi:phenylacetate-CoA ligase
VTASVRAGAPAAPSGSLYARFTEGVILPLYYGVTRNPALADHRRLERSQWWSRGELEAYQAARIRAILLHAWDCVPFYRQRFEALGADRRDLERPEFLARVPALTKKEVIEACDAFVDTSTPRRLHWTTTGGSTGETVRFCHDRDSLGNIKAREMRFHRWMGWLEGERVARLWGSPMERRQAYTWKNRLLRRIKNTLFLDGYDLRNEVMADYARRLLEFRPRVIIAFTSCLNILTEYLEQHGIGGIRPRAILTTSSPLYPSYRARFEAFYGCPVFDEYGSREFGGMAFECEAHGGLHVSVEDLHIGVTRGGEAVGSGDPGELIVTGLFNRAFPLIRYPIGDIGRMLPGACPCGRGSPLIEILKGRSSELLMGPKGIPVLGEFFIDLFDGLPGEVRQFRVYQSGPTRLRVHLVTAGGLAELKESSKAYVLRAIAAKFGEEMEVEFVHVDEIGPLPSGKHLLTVNETSPAFRRR